MDEREKAAKQLWFLGSSAMDLVQHGQHGRIGAIRMQITTPDSLGEVALVSMDVAIWLTHVRPLLQKLGLPLAEANPPR